MNERKTKNRFLDIQNIVFDIMDCQHLEQVAVLERECFFADAWSLELLEKELEDKFKHYFVAIKNNIILAYGGYAQILDEAHIMNIAVKAGFRNRGLASEILSRILLDAKERKIKRATLEVRETNLEAKALYEKFGFKIAGKRERYYQNTYDALIYWLEFGGYYSNKSHPFWEG